MATRRMDRLSRCATAISRTHKPMTNLATNLLYYGDNLDILRYDLPHAAVDLIYLDPPSTQTATTHLIFRDESGNATTAQLLAFEESR